MCYNKYQNYKTIEQYQEINNKKIKDALNNKREFVTEFPIFRNCEFDINKLIQNLDNFITHLFNLEEHVDYDLLVSTLNSFVGNSYASYLAPAYNFNNYIQLLIATNIDIFNKENSKYTSSAEYLYTIHIHNIFISIKCVLDRLVPILSYYYSGLGFHTTFGRINPNGKTKGLMGRVISLKDSDPLMKYIYEQYTEWIKRIVEPRDMIIHYNDMYSRTRYTHDGREFPMHYNINIFNTSDIENFDIDDGYYYKYLMKDVQRVYLFLDSIFEYLKKQPIIYQKQHFIKPQDFQRYKSNNYSFTYQD